MKSILFAGVVALALTSLAQQTQAPAAATAPAATETTTTAQPEMKKAVAKKAKKKAKPKAQTAQPAPAVVDSEMKNTSVPAVSPVVAAPAEGTSVATNTAAAAPTKKWGASINVNPSSDFNTPDQVGALTTLGASYKVTDSWKATLKQTFESVAPESLTDSNERSSIDSNNFRAAYTDLVASTSLPAVMGSDAIALSFGTRIINRDALVTRSGTLVPINAHYEANVIGPWTITPNWSTSVLGQYRHYDMQNDGQDRVIAMPSLSYAFNDVVSMYQAAGVLYSTQKAFNLEFRRTRALVETGLDIAPKKGLSINLNINQDKAIASSVDEVTPFNVYKPSTASAGQATLDAVAYEANISYSF